MLLIAIRHGQWEPAINQSQIHTPLSPLLTNTRKFSQDFALFHVVAPSAKLQHCSFAVHHYQVVALNMANFSQMLCGTITIHFIFIIIIIILWHSFSFISLPFWPWQKVCKGHLMTCSDARNSHDCVYQKVPPPSGDVVDHSTQRIWELHLQRSDPVEGKDAFFWRPTHLLSLRYFGVGPLSWWVSKCWNETLEATKNKMWYMITCSWGRVLASWVTILTTW